MKAAYVERIPAEERAALEDDLRSAEALVRSAMARLKAAELAPLAGRFVAWILKRALLGKDEQIVEGLSPHFPGLAAFVRDVTKP